MELTGAQALIKSLEMQQVEVMFGLPGGAILPVYDPILDSSIRHILVRHEQGAGHMAEGYAQVTGRPGVAMVTSGPGATNIVTPLAERLHGLDPPGRGHRAGGHHGHRHRRLPGVRHHRHHHGHHQAQLARSPTSEDIPRVVAEAFHVATTGRPGPVLIDIPKDIANATMEWYWPESVADLDLPGYHPLTDGDPALVRQAAELILAAERPVIYAGGGILKARGRRGPAGPGRAHRHPGGHHPHGPGRLPRLAPPVPGHARHARQLHRGHRHAARRPARSPSAAGSTTG